VEEGFGACLGAVIARAHLRAPAAHKPPAASNAVAAAVGGEWEHVDLFADAADAGTPPLAAGRRPDPGPSPEPPAKRCCKAGASAGGGGLAAAGDARGCDAEEALIGGVFRRVRRRLERLRRYNRAGRFREAREQAAAILGAAAPAGCRRLAAQAARLLTGSGYLPAAAVDEVEVQLDAAEAIWTSGRCVI
jgi:hypothetical protein